MLLRVYAWHYERQASMGIVRLPLLSGSMLKGRHVKMRMIALQDSIALHRLTDCVQSVKSAITLI